MPQSPDVRLIYDALIPFFCRIKYPDAETPAETEKAEKEKVIMYGAKHANSTLDIEVM